MTTPKPLPSVNEGLLAALKPFANVATYAPDAIGNPEVVVAVITDTGRWTIHLGLDDFRRAAAALASAQSEPAPAPQEGNKS